MRVHPVTVGQRVVGEAGDIRIVVAVNRIIVLIRNHIAVHHQTGALGSRGQAVALASGRILEIEAIVAADDPVADKAHILHIIDIVAGIVVIDHTVGAVGGGGADVEVAMVEKHILNVSLKEHRILRTDSTLRTEGHLFEMEE